ncbi:MAG: hypothetical protein DMD96_03000 [Candidatus Rokuibacteriota bacterium]|nr:MAG: hypothetical protein DMD96_03000 [Candidatus Rokubacteria bacterium]
MKALVLLAALLVFAAPALAQLYEWVDEKGQRNFADNINNVPQQYRSKMTESPGLQATPLQRHFERRRQDDLLAEQWAFERIAAACAKSTGVEIAVKPDRQVTYFGRSGERFAFEKCMTESGQPTRSVR